MAGDVLMLEKINADETMRGRLAPDNLPRAEPVMASPAAVTVLGIVAAYALVSAAAG